MEDKQRQVVQDCAHNNTSVWTVNKLMVFISEAAVVEAVVELCEEKGSCLTMPREEALCADTLAERGRRAAPSWIYSAAALSHVAAQHTQPEQRNHTLSSVHLLHTSPSHTLLVYFFFSLDYENTVYMRLIVSAFPNFL